MTKKIVFIVSFILVVAGIIIGYLAFPGAEIAGFAISLFGAGVLCAALWKKRKEGFPTWLAILSLVFIGIGAFIVGFLGFVELDAFKEIVGYVIAIISIIAGALIPVVSKKILNKKEVEKKI